MHVSIHVAWICLYKGSKLGSIRVGLVTRTARSLFFCVGWEFVRLLWAACEPCVLWITVRLIKRLAFFVL